jgi:hypothetical protein
LVGKPEERDHSENLSIDNNNKKWVFEAWVAECWLKSSDRGYWPVVGFCEHDNEPLHSGEAGISWLAEHTVRFSRRILLHRII